MSDGETIPLGARMREIHKSPALAWALFVAACALVTLLHLFRNGLNIDHKELWGDEAATFLLAVHPISDVLTMPTRIHSQPPLYYLLIHFVAPFGASEFILRGISWALCMGLLYFILFSLRELRLLSRVLLALLFIFNEFTVYLAQELRPYSLSALTSFVATAYLARLADAPTRWRTFAAYVAAATLMLYSLAFDVGVLLAHGLWALGFLLLRIRERGLRDAARTYYRVPLALASIALLYLPYLVFVSSHHLHEGKPSLAGSLRELTTWARYAGTIQELTPIDFPFSYALYGLALYAVVARRGSKAWLWALVLFVQIAFVHGFMYGRYKPLLRYMTPAFPALIYLVALGFDHLIRQKPRRLWAVALAVLLALTIKLGPTYASYARAPLPEQNWRRLSTELKKIEGKKAIFFRTGLYSVMLAYIARGDADIQILNGGKDSLPPGFNAPAIGADPITKKFVEQSIEKHRPDTRCFFYSMDRRRPGRDALFEGTFVPAMEKLGYEPTFKLESNRVPDPFHDHYDVRGYCRK
jgi:hypothetical protein